MVFYRQQHFKIKSAVIIKLDIKNFTNNSGPRKSPFQKLIELLSSCFSKIKEYFGEINQILNFLCDYFYLFFWNLYRFIITLLIFFTIAIEERVRVKEYLIWKVKKILRRNSIHTSLICESLILLVCYFLMLTIIHLTIIHCFLMEKNYSKRARTIESLVVFFRTYQKESRVVKRILKKLFWLFMGR
jgi:hypothetical protein